MEHPTEKGGEREKLKTKERRKNLFDKEEKNPTGRREKNYWQREEQKKSIDKEKRKKSN